MATTSRAPGTMPQPYPPHPGSPTFTNPDMILPDYDRASSPSLDTDRSQSPLMMWKNAYATTSSNELPNHLYTGAVPAHAFGTGVATPTTPIIYGNGTMLSDIGEVTEAESTPGRPSHSRLQSPYGRDGLLQDVGDVHKFEALGALRSSPTIGLDVLKKMAQRPQDRLRRSSLDSNSTITTHEHAAAFADFDDAVSVGDSVFQGDDEESLADSYFDDSRPGREPRAPRASQDKSDMRSDVASSHRGSAAVLSQRAEQILANAKRRLTTMEGNLSRARSSLHASSPSLSSIGSDGSSLSPSTPFRTQASAHDVRGHGPIAPGHARIGSDNALRIGLPVNVYPQRSASALGAAGGYRPPSAGSIESHCEPSQNTSNRRGHHVLSGRREAHLEPLAESDTHDRAAESEPDQVHDPLQLQVGFSPTFGPGEDGNALARPASAAQMRGLKDQMNDLKGKISSLREQARADSLRRRSFQSLRTPSPFTHSRVDQWYAEPDAPVSGASDIPPRSAQRSPWNGEMSGVDSEANVGSGADTRAIVLIGDSTTSSPPSGDNDIRRMQPALVGDDSPVSKPLRSGTLAQIQHGGVRGHVTHDDFDEAEGNCASDDLGIGEGDFEAQDDVMEEGAGYDSESGESSYHDTLQHPLSHEDRADAFDYEHFILHSALGTISQQRLTRGERRDSFSSDDSVETARGPVPGPALHRRNSNASTSTVGSVETFATADEGRYSREDTRENHDIDSEVPGNPRSTSPSAAPASPVIPEGRRPNADSNLGGGGGSSRSNSDSNSNSGSRNSSSRNSSRSSRNSSKSNRASSSAETTPPLQLLPRRPASSAATMAHRPSVSSLESAGTMRSFPLVTRKKASSVAGDVTTAAPIAGSNESFAAGPIAAPMDDHVQTLRSITDSLMSDAASIYRQSASPDEGVRGMSGPRTGTPLVTPATPAAMQQLLREDQFLVERLVAGIGRCILGLTETGRSSTESRMYRRRIDAARRILEGLDSPTL